MKSDFQTRLLNECAFSRIIENKPKDNDQSNKLIEAYENGELSLKSLCEKAGCPEVYESYSNGKISKEEVLNEVSGFMGSVGNFLGGAARKVRQGVADFKTNMNNQRQLARNYERERRRNQRAVNQAARDENRRRREQFKQNPDGFVDADFSNGQMDQRDKFADEHQNNYFGRQDDRDAAQDDTDDYNDLTNPQPRQPNVGPDGGNGGGSNEQPPAPPSPQNGGAEPSIPADNGKQPATPKDSQNGGNIQQMMQNLNPQQQQQLMQMISQFFQNQQKQLNAPQGGQSNETEMVQNPDGSYSAAANNKNPATGTVA